MGTYGDPTDYPDAGTLAGTETLLIDDGVDTLSTTVQDIADLADVSNADNLTSGTVADARIASTIARDSEVTAAISALATVYQPLDADLSAIAAASNGSVLAATTASFTTADETKLDGIEAGADVTDATNVAAAGAVMEADTSTASMSFVVDEDDMASNSATKVPTQQSVKAYVDANAGDASIGLAYVISQSAFAP